MKVLVRAPSNIALVKYMGKKDSSSPAPLNLPENPSLSMTLSSLCTFLELRVLAESDPVYENANVVLSEVPAGARGEPPRLSDGGREKFLRHLARCERKLPELLRAFGLSSNDRFPGRCELRSSNTFPHAAGIASSASSFAALTLASAVALAKDSAALKAEYKRNASFRAKLGSLSREGSGSSSRSFDGPFVAWENEEVSRLDSNLPPLSDLVIVVSSGEKEVGSSEAHARVKSSPHWSGRVGRATERYGKLRTAISGGDWQIVTEISDAEFRDMHGLFETSVPAFSYFEKGTQAILDYLENEHPDAKIAITLDAGPNVHVLVPQAEEEYWKKTLALRFPEYPILVDRQGTGAEILEVTP